MTIANLKKKLSSSDSTYRKIISIVIQKLPKDYIDEEVAVSETAEGLLGQYSLAYQTTHKGEFLEYLSTLNSLRVQYKTFDEVQKILLNYKHFPDIKEQLKNKPDGKGIRLATFYEGLELLRLN